MSQPQPQKKTRRLRQAPQTMRERAERAASQNKKPVRLSVLRNILRPIAKVRTLKVWKPFGMVGRFIGKILVPPYIRRSFAELRQVTWPDRRQTFALTSAVILFSIIFGTLVALFDFGLDKLFKQVILR